MDKEAYQKISTKLKVAQRCPLVGYCERWAWSIYFYSFVEHDKDKNMLASLCKDGSLPSDFQQRKIPLRTQHEISIMPVGDGDHDWQRGRGMCPEVALFSPQHTPGHIPREAITSYSWDRGPGMTSVEHAHFTECLEYIQTQPPVPIDAKKSQRLSIPPKLRFEILERDGFVCAYCHLKDGTGLGLHVDHIIPVKEGGTNDPANLTTSCQTCNFGKGCRPLKQ